MLEPTKPQPTDDANLVPLLFPDETALDEFGDAVGTQSFRVSGDIQILVDPAAVGVAPLEQADEADVDQFVDSALNDKAPQSKVRLTNQDWNTFLDNKINEAIAAVLVSEIAAKRYFLAFSLGDKKRFFEEIMRKARITLENTVNEKSGEFIAHPKSNYPERFASFKHYIRNLTSTANWYRRCTKVLELQAKVTFEQLCQDITKVIQDDTMLMAMVKASVTNGELEAYKKELVDYYMITLKIMKSEHLVKCTLENNKVVTMLYYFSLTDQSLPEKIGQAIDEIFNNIRSGK